MKYQGKCARGSAISIYSQEVVTLRLMEGEAALSERGRIRQRGEIGQVLGTC